MDEVAYAAALALAAVFAWAGGAKLASRAATERAFRGLGLVAPRGLALGVPVTELALAAGLVVAPAEAAIVALAVLAGFTTLLVRSLGRGDAGGCGCFGTSRPAPVSGVDVARNGLLGLAAVGAAFASGPVAPGLGAVAAVTVAAGTGAAGLAALRRRGGGAGLVAGHEGLPPGAAAPSVDGVRYDHGGRTLVAFLAPTCTDCDGLRAAVEARVSGAGDVRAALVELDDSSRSTFEAFHVRSAPYLVVIDPSGRVFAAGRATSAPEVEALLASSAGPQP